MKFILVFWLITYAGSVSSPLNLKYFSSKQACHDAGLELGMNFNVMSNGQEVGAAIVFTCAKLPDEKSDDK